MRTAASEQLRRETWRLWKAGSDLSQIAQALGVTFRTAKTHWLAARRDAKRRSRDHSDATTIRLARAVALDEQLGAEPACSCGLHHKICDMPEVRERIRNARNG